MNDLLIWILNFILSSCNYSYQITDFSINFNSVVEAHARVEYCLRKGGVLNPEETLKCFFERDDVQQAFQDASTTWQLRREYKEHLIKIMTQ